MEGRVNETFDQRLVILRPVPIQLTVFPPHLVLRDDDLRGIRVVRPRYGVFEDTDRPDHLARLDHPDLARVQLLAGTKVAGIPDHALCPDGLPAAGHAGEDARLVHVDRLDRLVEHVRPPVDRRETGKGLGELAEAVEGVDVG